MTTRRLFATVETPEADPRQRQFRDALAKLLAQFEGGADMPPLEGFPASHVDLGWLQDQIREFVRVHSPTFEELAELLDTELPRVVQRAKSIAVGNIGWPDVVEIAFETKDDASSYFYRLFVPLVD